MNIEFDQFGRQRGVARAIAPATHPGQAAAAARASTLDWRGLVARLAAAHASRAILTDPSTARPTPSGSFAPGLARHVAIHPAAGQSPDTALSQSVNPTPKADRKHSCAIGDACSGGNKTGVRGLK